MLKTIRRLFTISLSLFAAASSEGSAKAETHVLELEVKGAPANAEEFRSRLNRISEALDDSEARFSGTDAFKELSQLRDFTEARPELLSERKDILSKIGKIVARSQVLPYEDGLSALDALFALDQGDEPQTKQRLYDHFYYAKLAGGYASAEEKPEYHMCAAEEYGKAAALADTLPDFDENQSAGIRQEQAFELHEAGRYEEALALNKQLLAFGENRFSPDSPKLTSILTNIAQNLHKLERKNEAEPYLIRVQKIAEAEGDLEKVQDMLFQRGVLAYELGHPEKAREYMLDRIARLKAADESDSLATAEEDYAELERRIAEH